MSDPSVSSAPASALEISHRLPSLAPADLQLSLLEQERPGFLNLLTQEEFPDEFWNPQYLGVAFLSVVEPDLDLRGGELLSQMKIFESLADARAVAAFTFFLQNGAAKFPGFFKPPFVLRVPVVYRDGSVEKVQIIAGKDQPLSIWCRNEKAVTLAERALQDLLLIARLGRGGR